MPRKPALRPVAEDERQPGPVEPLTLLEAIESGTQLDILLAQRRLIAASLSTASDSVRPQLSNELTKLNALIAVEAAKAADEEGRTDDRGGDVDESFDASAV